MTTLLAAAATLPLCDVAYPPGTRRAGMATCLVDADTGWHRGRKWRLVGVDAPETSRRNADCAGELTTGRNATAFAMDMMSGGYAVETSGRRDRNGRDLVRIRLSDGSYLGEALLKAELAVVWPHPKGVWC
jgi:endonuclease YncB( thermonuclease family)